MSDLEKQGLNFEGISAAELLTIEFPEPKWAIPSILPEGLTILAGKPKRGKSILSLNLALSIASGGKAFGKFDVEQGTVLCFALEDTARRLQHRIKQMLVSGEKAPEKLILFNNCSRIGEGAIEEIGALIEKHSDVRLVIIDTLVKIRPVRNGGNSNIYTTDYQDVSGIKDLADEHGISIVLVHHVRKLEADDIMDTLSGSFGLTGAADGIIVLDRMTGLSDAFLYITGRDVEEEKYALNFQSDTLSWQYMGKACDVRSTDQQQLIVDVFKGAKTDEFSPKQIAEATGLKVSYVKNTFPKLKEAGIIKKAGYGKYIYVGDTDDCADSSDHDDSDDHDDLEDTADTNDTTDYSSADNVIEFKSTNDTDDSTDSSGVTAVTTAVKYKKREIPKK